MDCPKCKKETRIMVQATLSTPSRFYGNFTKKNLSNKECYLMGVNWETADIICEHCGHTTTGYGNYVTNLQKQNERLVKENKKLRRKS